MTDQNRLQRASIRSEENSSIVHLNQQYQLTLADTRSSSNRINLGSNKKSTINILGGWSNTNTYTSGVNNDWTHSNGYSDAHTTGHAETATNEHSVYNSISRMFSQSFNSDKMAQ